MAARTCRSDNASAQRRSNVFFGKAAKGEASRANPAAVHCAIPGSRLAVRHDRLLRLMTMPACCGSHGDSYAPPPPADGAMRASLMKIGSDEHKILFCRQFLTSHLRYAPETLPWPDLDESAAARLRAVPFWQEVLHAERRAGVIIRAFAETLDDLLVREAVDLQGIEEARHAELLRVMIARYGIEVTEQPLEAITGDIETAFKDFGYAECLDSFLGFGVFKIARQSGFLPDSMFSIFETLMLEETRHIVFFINWIAWQEARDGRAWRRNLTALRFYGRAINRIMRIVRRGRAANGGRDFSATQVSIFLEGFTFRRFVEDCYAENARRMKEFDAALLRPRFLPDLAGMSLAALRLWQGRQSARSVTSAP
jgi:hypothetical protein